jgi:hypothetical protein
MATVGTALRRHSGDSVAEIRGYGSKAPLKAAQWRGSGHILQTTLQLTLSRGLKSD